MITANGALEGETTNVSTLGAYIWCQKPLYPAENLFLKVELPMGSPLMGVLPEARYDEQSLELKPGDTLLVYSDGLTEAMNERGDLYGDERLEALLPRLRDLTPAVLGARLVREVELFTADERQSDDLSLVILRREGA